MFEVKTKDGLTLEFGYTPDSRVEGNVHWTVLKWQLNKITDANGNYMTYTYTEVNKESLIQQINYTGNISQGFVPATYASIKFTYNSRTTNRIGYIADQVIPQTKLLTEIKTEYNGTGSSQQVRKYQLMYDQQPLTINYRLTEIKCYGTNNSQLNSTLISWGNASGTAIGYNMVLPDGTMEDIYYQTVGDFDGNGVDDIVAVRQGNDVSTDPFEWYLYERDGTVMMSGGQQIGQASLYDGYIKAVDIDSDGKDEIVMVHSFGLGSGTNKNHWVRVLKWGGIQFLFNAELRFQFHN